MKKILVILLVSVLLLGCTSTPPKNTISIVTAKSTPIPSIAPNVTVLATFTPTPAANGSATATPSVQPVSEAYLAISKNRVGVTGLHAPDLRNLDFSYANDLSGAWTRTEVSPFNRQEIETGPGTYDYSKADAFMDAVQNNKLAVLATLWPYADWDQKECQPISCNSPEYETLSNKRCLPCNSTDYTEFVKKTVARYSANSFTYPIKYWQVGFAPDMQTSARTYFKGSAQDYADLLKQTYTAIKSVCSDCVVLMAGVGGLDAEDKSYLDGLLKAGAANYFDAVTLYSENKVEDGYASLFNGILYAKNISKPFWIVDLNLGSGDFGLTQDDRYSGYFISDAEQAGMVTRGIVGAFASKADKVFYGTLKALPTQTLLRQSFALVGLQNSKRASYSAVKTLSDKIGTFSSVSRLSATQFKFIVDGKPVYVVWGKTGEKLDASITGKLMTTSIWGLRQTLDASEILLEMEPVYLEPLTG